MPADRRILVEEARLKESSAPPTAKTRELLDWVKWLAMTAGSLVAIGWMGSEYLQRFQTKEEADKAQREHEQRLESLRDKVEELRDEQFRQRYTMIQVGLEVRNASDRMQLLIEMEKSGSPGGRRDAERAIGRLRIQIQRREQVIESPARLEAAARSPDVAAALDGT